MLFENADRDVDQSDFTIAGVTLSAGALDRDGGDLVRRLLEHGGNKIAYAAFRQELAIEGIPRHYPLIEQLVVPAYFAGPLGQDRRDTRIDRCELFEILHARDRGQA